MRKKNLILAFESSCDETSVAVIENGEKILSNVIATQINSHKRFGGVVPEVASRHHIEQVTICIDEALEEANVKPSDLTAVAVTYGPGLVGALLVGVAAAKAFAYANNLPLVPVNHMAGHIYAARFVKPIVFPAMALLVSGGHTELVYMPYENEFQIIGETRDDAAGEAYDKIGRVLGMTYPAGKDIDELAHKGKDSFHFPRAMMHEDNFDFSFSGLKSAFINTVHHADQINETLDRADLAASFQQSVVDVIVEKTLWACKQFSIKQLILAGGVAANHGLRDTLSAKLNEKYPDLDFVKAPLELCGDNAAMIGAAGYVTMKHHVFADASLNAEPSLEFDWVPDAVK
ncbi:tRNA (adenosine(37)-N6)-threonylcarbamoyltransferase complex transferase subunit TsaD [Pediococcus ethanolidurans]|uniref:tRNA (adenosine(37)-N6)-threonylcarbamoyltransferase complex transferase subunit TsaD n=1 Tax=Pediococcus ethanolidurans TaxID=319653 RepID=UPI001C1EAE14|nr:tRNA (adenosine(37)-N6)-threonylcarbamoyltransferase complex transferase subunit TsaD [Pediococcus ethanolidurans]MBU7555202.1 tRNA (adenosine(37)-N6)-threonylcarbamoyltransferase complex transferase subunit TsaD [Pediococcus ethanolidurans]MBU7562820.1 tRNA (adenosine(37)-N6)-threonylcarbamoyltransferase complex transferase subunit TsaD [Pediococcus ethanolidurans]MCV3314779.1 tRNA (adenosine(37)-N6)-threonylcarbamoyltransferase complex transferase subunit TsaD [Pediococcus ethanolidurans]M